VGKRGTLLVLALILIVTLAAGIPYYIASEDARRPPLEEHREQLQLPRGLTLESLERVEVYDIIDGDTIQIRKNGDLSPVRYFGIDTPERGERCYREALDRNELLLTKHVYLLPDERDNDGQRPLRYIFLEDGTSLDATMVAEGFAYAWRRDGRYRDQIVALEEQAKAEGRGCLWSSDG
jgi:endonuclease YncB( thermonuclease family)